MSRSGTPDGHSVYLRAITEDILGWSDPAERLKTALADDHFLLYAQRIHSLQAGAPGPYYCEVLLRLREEEDNMLPPGGFFPVAEALGMLEDIDRWVVAHTLAWRATRPNPPVCFINLSIDSIRNPDFSVYVRRHIEASKMPGSNLCFEITEPDLLAQPDAVQHFIANLKPLRCLFALDNFGSVKISFNHIKDLPIDYLKVDGSIIQNILKSPGDFARAQAISLTCQRLGIRTIAQNVEHREVLARLRNIGFGFVQGFGISRPRPINALKNA
ncbi:MAG: EAL domain-containing protein [Burkholderiales bacterium]